MGVFVFEPFGYDSDRLTNKIACYEFEHIVAFVVLSQRSNRNNDRVVILANQDRARCKHSSSEATVIIGEPDIDGDKAAAVIGGWANPGNFSLYYLFFKAVDCEFHWLSSRDTRNIPRGNHDPRFHNADVDDREQLGVRPTRAP